MSSPVINVWCDGSCPATGGPGGWAAILLPTEAGTGRALVEKELTGYELETTNQRMELQAAAEALYFVTRAPARFHIVSDSQYLTRGMTEWSRRWARNGWHNSAGKPVANRDLWEPLLAAAAFHTVTWEWVKGHAGHEMNERADVLAGEQTLIARDVAASELIEHDLEQLERALDHAIGGL